MTVANNPDMSTYMLTEVASLSIYMLTRRIKLSGGAWVTPTHFTFILSLGAAAHGYDVPPGPLLSLTGLVSSRAPVPQRSIAGLFSVALGLGLPPQVTPQHFSLRLPLVLTG